MEDFLYAFFIGGVASSIYEWGFGLHMGKRKIRQHDLQYMLLPFIFFPVVAVIGFYFLKLNPIYTAILLFLLIAAYMISRRPDLLKDVVMSGLMVGILTLVGYIVFLLLFPEVMEQWWHLSNISGVLVMGIPIEELVWAFGVGAIAGPYYEFLQGFKLVSRKTVSPGS